MARTYTKVYCNKIELINGEIIEEYSWISNTGKSFVIRVRDEDGVSRSQRVIPIADIYKINGELYNKR